MLDQFEKIKEISRNKKKKSHTTVNQIEIYIFQTHI